MNPWGFLPGYFRQIVEFQVSEKPVSKEGKKKGRKTGKGTKRERMIVST